MGVETVDATGGQPSHRHQAPGHNRPHRHQAPTIKFFLSLVCILRISSVLCIPRQAPTRCNKPQALHTKRQNLRFPIKRQAPSIKQGTLCTEHQALLLFTGLHASIPFVPRSFCISVLKQLLINAPMFFPCATTLRPFSHTLP